MSFVPSMIRSATSALDREAAVCLPLPGGVAKESGGQLVGANPDSLRKGSTHN